MPAGQPKLPTEYKRLKGTLNVTREKRQGNSDVVLAENTSLIIPEEERMTVPKSLTTKDGRKFWKLLTTALKELHVLAKIDLAQVETLCITYEKMKEAQNVFIKTSPLEEDYDAIQKRWQKLVAQFNQMAAMYYINPVNRSKLRLEELSAIKTKQDIEKDDAISLLIAGRKGVTE